MTRCFLCIDDMNYHVRVRNGNLLVTRWNSHGVVGTETLNTNEHSSILGAVDKTEGRPPALACGGWLACVLKIGYMEYDAQNV